MSDIILKSITKNDIEMIRNWRNSPEVSAYMYSDSIITIDQQEKWFEKIRNEKNSIYWVIEYNGRNLGLASLTGIDKTLSSCYWAFYLGDLSVRGGGIGAKIEYNILEYVFNVLKLNKLRCEVLVNNDKVIRMHEKYGFRREAYYREHCIKNGQKLDVVGLAILQTEWLLIKEIIKSKIYGQ